MHLFWEVLKTLGDGLAEGSRSLGGGRPLKVIPGPWLLPHSLAPVYHQAKNLPHHTLLHHDVLPKLTGPCYHAPNPLKSCAKYPSSLKLFFRYFVTVMRKANLGFCDKVPSTWWLKQQKLILSQFWRLEIHDQGIGSVGFC
jgi:hypothetical protein